VTAPSAGKSRHRFSNHLAISKRLMESQLETVQLSALLFMTFNKDKTVAEITESSH
jgi:hypothetical protein